MATLGRRYLVHIRLGAGKPATNRVERSAAGVKEILVRLSLGKNNCQLAYTSHDGASFGFFLKTTRYAAAIRNVLESPGVGPHPLLDEDSILIVEIGEDFKGHGFSRAWTWLQHH